MIWWPFGEAVVDLAPMLNDSRRVVSSAHCVPPVAFRQATTQRLGTAGGQSFIYGFLPRNGIIGDLETILFGFHFHCTRRGFELNNHCRFRCLYTLIGQTDGTTVGCGMRTNDPSELISGAWCNGTHITVTEPEPTPLLHAVRL